MGFVELWSLGAGNTYFALKNYKRDITKLYTVGTQEQQFHSEHYDAVNYTFILQFYDALPKLGLFQILN